jgi:hypothetical protein
MVSLDKFAAEKLERAAAQSLLRTLPAANMAGLNFSSNDYLGLSRDPRLAEASAKAARMLGTGAGASRLVTGNHEGYATCEAAIAALTAENRTVWAEAREAHFSEGVACRSLDRISCRIVGPGLGGKMLGKAAIADDGKRVGARIGQSPRRHLRLVALLASCAMQGRT